MIQIENQQVGTVECGNIGRSDCHLERLHRTSASSRECLPHRIHSDATVGAGNQCCCSTAWK
jgi:hypothetical protein